MTETDNRLSMSEFETREAGRYIATFVPPDNIQTATSIPEAILKAHVASEHIGRKQGKGTSSIEPYFIGVFSGDETAKKRKIVEETGKLGVGNLNVLAYRLNQVEKGAGEYAMSFAHRLTANHDVQLSRSGTIMRELEEEALRTLHLRAGTNVSRLKSQMKDEAIEWRAKTHEYTGDVRQKYEIAGRVEKIRKIDMDKRSPIITGEEVRKIIQDLKSEGQYRLAAGYNHMVDLFTGTLKGAQERLYLDNRFMNGMKRSD